MKVTKRERKTSGIDLSPMLDIIFQLILFFLVSTTFASLPAISVNLPSSTTSQGTSTGGVTITMDKDGSIYFNGEESSLILLDVQLKSLNVDDDKKWEYPVIISADDQVTNGNIVKVFDSLRRNGFTAVSLRTSTEVK